MRAAWPSENLLLGLLSERPMHGYELAQLVSTEEALRVIWHLKRSEVYFLLSKLLERGCIEEIADPVPASASDERQPGAPPRTIYGVTPAGRQALTEWLTEPERSPRGVRAAFIAKLYLASCRDPGLALRLTEKQQQALTEWRDRFRGETSPDPFVGMVQKLRLAQVEALLNALDEMQVAISGLVGGKTAQDPRA